MQSVVFNQPFPDPNMSEGKLALMNANLFAQQMGKYGSKEFSGSGTHNGNWCAIKAFNGGCTISSVTGTGIDWSNQQILDSGDVFYGEMTQVVISSGKGALYKSRIS